SDPQLHRSRDYSTRVVGYFSHSGFDVESIDTQPGRSANQLTIRQRAPANTIGVADQLPERGVSRDVSPTAEPRHARFRSTGICLNRRNLELQRLLVRLRLAE